MNVVSKVYTANCSSHRIEICITPVDHCTPIFKVLQNKKFYDEIEPVLKQQFNCTVPLLGC